jgi:DNA-binding MarR family transcriptional regulator
MMNDGRPAASRPMERNAERDLEILTAIGEGRPLSQRALAQRLGVALGLTNLLLKRLARKGSIKIVEFPKKPAARKRLRYLLTPKGIAEKGRLTYEHMAYSIHVYRRSRQTLRESLSQLASAGVKRIVLYGTGEPAELAYLTLKEFGLEPVGVFAREANGHFLGFPVRAIGEIVGEEFDGVIVAAFDHPEQHAAELARLNVPREKILTLRQLASPPPAGSTRVIA